MKNFPEDFDFLKELGLLQTENVKEPPEFFFDDEPLERILYGGGGKGPTQANLFLPALKYVQEIAEAYKDGNIREALERISDLGKKGYSLSTGACLDLSVIIKGIVPHYPNPVISFDLLALAPLIEQIWDLALKREDRILQEAVGVSLYRWYEHQKRFEDAREIITILLEIDRENGDRADEAVLLNNFAFEYLLADRYQEAMPLFEEAANIFQEIGNQFEHINVRANYWICRVECDDFNEFEALERELQVMEKTFSKLTDWRARKPLILRAKIEERRGNINAAIQLVEQAIEVGKKANTRYPEMDANYLEQLRKRIN